MTINIADNSPRANYTATSGQTVFTVSFEFFDEADLTVYINGTETSAYTVTGGDGSTGTVTLTSGATAGDKIAIVRDVAIERTTDFTEGAAISRSALNEQLDKLTAQVADINDRASRSLQLNDHEVAASTSLPATDDRKGKVLGFNEVTGDVQSGPSLTDVQSLADVSADIATLADIEDGTDATDAIQTAASISSDITTVSGISSNVTTVAGISSDVTAVAADATDIGTVATNISSVNTVATNIADVITVANDLNEAVSEVVTVADDLNEAVSEIDTVAASISNVNTVGTNIADVNTVAGISANVTTVAGISANTTTVAGISANVTTVAGISSDVTAVAADATDIGTVATSISNVNAVAGNATNINAVAGNATNINAVAADAVDIGTVAGISANVSTVAGLSSSVSTLALISSDITTVAGISANVTTVAGDTANIATIATNLNGTDTIGTVASNISNVNAVASNSSNINSVAGNSANINAVAADASDIGVVAADISNVNSVGTNISNVNTVATNLTSINSFAATYRIGTTDPTTSLDAGDLFYNTTSGTLKVYSGTGWEQGVTAGSGFLPLTGGTLTGNLVFSGTETVDGRDVSVDGTKLDGIEAGADVTDAANVEPLVDAHINVSGATSGQYLGWNGTDYAWSTVDLSTKLDLAGGTMTGALVLNADPTAALGASTKQYVDTQVAGIVDSAPATLDTLNELAAALGDDPNFATTVTNSIGTKLPLAGGTLTGALDVQSTVTADGLTSSAVITAQEGRSNTAGTGQIVIDPDDTTVSAAFRLDQADNKLNIDMTNAGTWQKKLSVYTNGDISFYEDTGTTAKFFWDASAERLGIGASSPSQSVDTTGKVRIRDGGNTTIPSIQIGSTGVDGFALPATNTLGFITNSAERFRVDASGNLLVGKTSADTDLTGIELRANNLLSSTRASSECLFLNRKTSDGDIAKFAKDGTTVGSIGSVSGVTLAIDGGAARSGLQFNSSGVDPRYNGALANNAVNLGQSSYRFKDGYFAGTVNAANFNTTSDATLKTNVETLTGSLDAVKALRGVSFDWIESGNSEVGVIAQEVEAVVPNVVSTDDQGIKSVKYGNIVAVLIEAIKEQQEQIDALKEQLNS